ncbi:MAG: hypothetical protein WC047_06330 [Kiritimatiellales bacterium]
MDSGERGKQKTGACTKGVTIETLGIILGASIFGATAAVSIMRAMQGGTETVSITGLLSFLLTLGLSLSAIVLSVAAIALSRTAERTITQKSEEMSAGQTAMFAQTVAAIEHVVKSSVRRIGEEIADTVYKKFERLAEEIRNSLPSRDVLRADVTEAVERSLADAGIVVKQKDDGPDKPEKPVAKPEPEAAVTEEKVLTEEVAAEPLAPEPVTDEIREKADRKYGEFKDIVLLGVANYPGVIARKIGEGHYRTEGDELVDGVFIVQNEKVAVCTFCTGDIIVDRFMGETGDSFNGFLHSLFNELKRGHFTRVLLVFDGQLANTSPYAKALNGLSGRIDTETFSRFELFEGTPAVVIPELTERISQLMEEPPAADDEEDVQELSFRRQVGA